MITISAIWTLCVLQFKAAFTGNQTWKLVSNTPESVLKKSLEKIELGDVDEDDSDENIFLYKFTLSIILSALIFLLEIGICSYLMLENHSALSYYTAFAILYKDLILFGLFATWNTKNNSLSLFESLNIIPKWARNLERFSAFLSAAAFLFLAWNRLNSQS